MKSPKRPEAAQRVAAASTLFITYDGLTDPLGGSQILPYLRSIAGHPRRVHILSFEKPERFAAAGEQLREQLVADGIGWTPLSFSRGGKLAKGRDLTQMHVAATRLMKHHRFDIVHCRSYQAAQVGCHLKRWFGAKVLFDMRGLWVDERIDGGLWQLERPVDRAAYHYYKRVERTLLERADHIVVLTHRVVPELRRLAPKMRADVTVIPCCADFEHFDLLAENDKVSVRTEIGLPPQAMVISYLGSLGTWYCLDDMFDVFITAAKERADAHFLLITRDWTDAHAAQLAARGGATLASRVHVRPGTRDQVPRLLGASDVMLSFILPAYSKMASSPTKLAEAFACGVPALCNPGIGDVDTQLAALGTGALLAPDRVRDSRAVTTALDELAALDGRGLRARARAELDLPVAAERYRQAYQVLDPW